MAHRLLALHVCCNIGVYPIILQFKYVIKFYQWSHRNKLEWRSTDHEILREYHVKQYISTSVLW